MPKVSNSQAFVFRLRRTAFIVSAMAIVPTVLGAVILSQLDVGWIAIISGIFAIVWGLLRTGIVIAGLNKGRFRLSG
jgi:hypothetical protein